MNISIKQDKNETIIASLNEKVHTFHSDNHSYYFKPYNYEAMVEAIKNMLSKENYISYIAYDDKIPIGYIVAMIKKYEENIFRNPYKTVHIEQLAVEQKYKRLGIGQLLLNSIIEFAKNQNIQSVELAYWSGNVEADAFYKKNNFHEMYKSMRKKII